MKTLHKFVILTLLMLSMIPLVNAIEVTQRETTRSYIIEIEDTFELSYDNSLTEIDLQAKILKLYGRFLTDDSNSTMPSGTKYFGFSFNATLSDGVLCYVDYDEEFGGICKDKSLFTYLPNKNTPNGMYEHIYYISWASIPTTTDKDFSIEFEFNQKPETMITYFGTGSTIVVTETTGAVEISTNGKNNASYQMGDYSSGGSTGELVWFYNSTLGSFSRSTDDFYAFMGAVVGSASNNDFLGGFTGSERCSKKVELLQRTDLYENTNQTCTANPDLQVELKHYRDSNLIKGTPRADTTLGILTDLNTSHFTDFRFSKNNSKLLMSAGNQFQHGDVGITAFGSNTTGIACGYVWDEDGGNVNSINVDLSNNGKMVLATDAIFTDQPARQWPSGKSYYYDCQPYNNTIGGDESWFTPIEKRYNATILRPLNVTANATNINVSCPAARTFLCGDINEYPGDIPIPVNATNVYLSNATELNNATWTMNLTENGITLFVGFNGTLPTVSPGQSELLWINTAPIIVDTTPPDILINLPVNITYDNNTIWFNISVVDTENTIDQVFAEVDGTNHTMTNSSGNYNYFNGTLEDGTHIVRFYGNDSEGNMNDTQQEFFSIDTTPPVIIIDLPVNITYDNNTIWFNVSSVDVTNETESVWVVINNDLNNNHSLTNQSGNWGYLNDTLSDGQFNATFYSNDTLGNINATQGTLFTIDTRLPNVTLNFPLNNSRNQTSDARFFNFDTFAFNGREILNASVYGNFSGTWALNTTNSSAITNNTNFTITTPRHRDDRTYIWNVEVYDTSGRHTFAPENFTLIMNQSALRVNVLDEETLVDLFFNITVENSTISVSDVNTTLFTFPSNGSLPTGSNVLITIDIWNVTPNSYERRTYFQDININTFIDRTLFLLKTSSGQSVCFTVLNIDQVPVQGVIITAQKSIGGVFQTVEQRQSDSSGTATMFLDQDTSYRVIFEASGFPTETQTITPASVSGCFQQTLASVFLLNFSEVLEGVQMQFLPTTSGFRNISLQAFNFSVETFGSNVTINNFGLNLTLPNGTLFQSVVVLQNNGTANITIDLSSISGTLTATGFINRQGFDEFSINKTYNIHLFTPGNFSIWQVLQDMDNGLLNVTGFERGLIVSVTTLSGVMLGGGIAGGASALAGVAVLSVWAFSDIISWGFVIVTLLIVISILILKARY